jgi:hypothetical protein
MTFNDLVRPQPEPTTRATSDGKPKSLRSFERDFETDRIATGESTAVKGELNVVRKL